MTSRRTTSTAAYLFVALGCWHLPFLGVVAAQQTVPPVPFASPGETGRRVTDDGLLANYFPAPGKGPAVLMFGGSEGGLGTDFANVAKAMQTEGLTVLQVSYFRGPGQNPRLELIPLEYFATALRWLRRQAEVDPARMAVVGVSEGAEAALLVGVRHPEVKAVIAALPSSVVWAGVVWEGTTMPINSSWSEAGKPVPYLAYTSDDALKGGTLGDMYAASLKEILRHPDAIIPVEQIEGRVLLVCGEEDQLWPSCPMARQIEQRLREHRRPAATVLAYKAAGHPAFGLPLPPDSPRLTGAGGTAEANNAARADSLNKAFAFLKAALRN